MKRWLLVWVLPLFSVSAIVAQDVVEALPPPPTEARGIDRLQPLLPALEEAQAELQRLHTRLAEAVTTEERAEIEAEVDQQRLRLSQLRENFRMLATGVEESEYRQEEIAPTSLQNQLEDIIEPISRGMREMTSGPREMAKMREDLEAWQERGKLGESALKRLEPLLETAAPGLLRDELEDTRRLWTGRLASAESLLYQGIPWQVEKLNFYCEFRNPELAGGLLRLPVRDVMPLHSRPLAEKEEWFPSRMDDWVKLADGTFGKVIQQTPDHVVILKLGGSLKSYQTALFLEQTPENLSRGFRLTLQFGIDYQHQAISTTEVPVIFQQAIEQRLNETVGKDGLRSLKVEFASAGASSLDFAILADFAGGVASRCNVLERLIQKTCVEVCNEQGWVIPFTQITVHQANKELNH